MRKSLVVFLSMSVIGMLGFLSFLFMAMDNDSPFEGLHSDVVQSFSKQAVQHDKIDSRDQKTAGTTQNLKLIGIFKSGRAESLALLRLPDGSEKYFRSGEDIPDCDYSLFEIKAASVLLKSTAGMMELRIGYVEGQGQEAETALPVASLTLQDSSGLDDNGMPLLEEQDYAPAYVNEYQSSMYDPAGMEIYTSIPALNTESASNHVDPVQQDTATEGVDSAGSSL